MIKDNQQHFNRLHVVVDALVVAAAYLLAWTIQFKLVNHISGFVFQDYMLILIPLKAFMIFCGMLEIAFHALSIGFSMNPLMLSKTPCTLAPRPGNPSLSPMRSAMLTAVLSAASSCVFPIRLWTILCRKRYGISTEDRQNITSRWIAETCRC